MIRINLKNPFFVNTPQEQENQIIDVEYEDLSEECGIIGKTHDNKFKEE